MKKFLTITTFAFLTFVGTAQYALAQSTGLVPCGDGTPCTICHAFVLFDRVIDFLLSITFIVGIVLVFIAGILYIVSAGNQSMVQLAKTTLKNVVIGVVIMLAAWLIISTIFRSLASNPTAATRTNTAVQFYFAPGNEWDFSCVTP